MSKLRERVNSFFNGLPDWVWLLFMLAVFIYLVVQVKNIVIGK